MLTIYIIINNNNAMCEWHKTDKVLLKYEINNEIKGISL